MYSVLQYHIKLTVEHHEYDNDDQETDGNTNNSGSSKFTSDS